MGPNVSSDGEPCGAPGDVTDGGSDGFTLDIEEEGSTLRLRLEGELDWGCIGRVEAALERLSRASVKHVILDLRKLEFMDSAGLRTILRANERARAEALDVVVVRPRGLANRVFTLTRASRQLKLVDGA